MGQTYCSPRREMAVRDNPDDNRCNLEVKVDGKGPGGLAQKHDIDIV